MGATERWRGLGVAAAIQLGRLVLIVAASALLPLCGLRGWDVGLAVNVLCCVYAVVLMTAFRLWRESGILRIWAGRRAVVALIPLALEACSWLVPGGVLDLPPGLGWWLLSMVLVGFNEELVSRVVVLTRLRRAFSAVSAVVIGGALFGLQHLSRFATQGADLASVGWVVLSAMCFGLAYGAFQLRFRWVLPLILMHALSDWFGIVTPGSPGDLLVIGSNVLLFGTAVVLLRTRRDDPPRDMARLLQSS